MAPKKAQRGKAKKGGKAGRTPALAGTKRRDESAADRAREDEPSSDGPAFEDPYEDEYIDEAVAADEDDDEPADDAMADDAPPAVRVWRPGAVPTKADGELELDPRAYRMYHAMRSDWPCLSFDLLCDELGGARTRFPHVMYAVCGTQADRADQNKLTLMKMSELHKMRRTGGDDDMDDDEDEDDDDDDDDDDDAADDDPVLAHASVPHPGTVNRVRAMPQRPSIVASWSEDGRVRVFDMSGQLASLDPPQRLGSASVPRRDKPIFTFAGHRDEGYALDWSSVAPGWLATGDCAGGLHVWAPRPGGGDKAGGGGEAAASSWDVNASPLTGHSGSVEDVQWSPTEPSVFISASADHTLRVWDTRHSAGAMLTVQAHDSDVNVASWNRHITYLLASGADDGSFKVWDLRAFGSAAVPDPVGHFRHHKAPVTSIMWHPTDESVLAVSGADDQLTIWDLSVEDDSEATAASAVSAGAVDVADLPPQLLFVHQGQRDIKELRFHPQIPGAIVSSAADGFNIFKPAI